MDIDNLTKEGFIDLVDQMLDIVYVGNPDHYKNKINKLIELFCKNPLQITNISEIKNHITSENYNVEKIIPCNTKESLLLKIMDEKKKINFSTKINNHKGTYSKIYNKYSNNLDGKIVKTSIIENGFETLFSMLFEYLLYEHIKQPNYLCKIYEIGKYDNDVNNFFYSIMDNCGIDLYDFFQKIRNAKKKLKDEKNKNIEDKNKINKDKKQKIKNINDQFSKKKIELNSPINVQAQKKVLSNIINKSVSKSSITSNIKKIKNLDKQIKDYPNKLKILFQNVLIIFYKMTECVKILFDLGYAHLDIKPANFLISSNDNTIDLEKKIFEEDFEKYVQVKIIDFGTLRKIDSSITFSKSIGTENYMHPDLVLTKSENKKEIPKSKVIGRTATIKKEHDIYSLRKSFEKIIIMLFIDNVSNETTVSPQSNVSKIEEKKSLNNISNNLKKLKNINSIEIFYTNIFKNFLEGMSNSTYTDINILMKALLKAIFLFLHKDDEKKDKIFSLNHKININKQNEDTFDNIFKYYSSMYQLEIETKLSIKNIAKERYRKLYKLYITTHLIDKNNENLVENKLDEYLNKIIDRYLLKIYDVGYQNDGKDSLTYFRITDKIDKYISLENYFNNIVRNIDMSDPVIQYKLLTRILYVFSLIMNCIQLITYFDRYNLEVSLDNFIIKDDGNIDIKVTNGIQYNGLNTKPIQALGYLLFRVLYKCFGYINQTSVFNKVRKTITGKEKDKQRITNNNAKVVEINKNQKKISSILSVVKIDKVYLKDLTKIIKIMINSNINIDDLISIFREFRKTIYLNEILNKYTKISTYSGKICDIDCDNYFITQKNGIMGIFYKLEKEFYKIKNFQGTYEETNIDGIYIISDNYIGPLNKNIDEKKNILLKITDKTEKEINGIVFEFLLYNYIEYFYPSQLRHLCKTHEIGTIKSIDKKEKYYSIIDKYGVNLNEFIKSIGNDYNINFLYNILKIFYEMMECIEIIHDLGFLYLNIKPTNFLLLIDNLDFPNISSRRNSLNSSVKNSGSISSRLILNNNSSVRSSLIGTDNNTINTTSILESNISDNESSKKSIRSSLSTASHHELTKRNSLSSNSGNDSSVEINNNLFQEALSDNPLFLKNKEKIQNNSSLLSEKTLSLESIEEFQSSSSLKSPNIILNNIKITDFSNVRRIGSTTKEYIGDIDYIPSDWKKYQNQKTRFQIKGFELKIHHDIFSLGCIFKKILTELCDNNLNTLKQKFFNKALKSKNNDDKISKIIDKLMGIINKMVEPDPEKRYQDIHTLMVEFGYLISDISKIVEEEPDNNSSIKSIKNFEDGKYKVFYDGKSLPYIEFEGKKYPIRKSYLSKLINNTRHNNIDEPFDISNHLLKNNEYKLIKEKILDKNEYLSNNYFYTKINNNKNKIYKFSYLILLKTLTIEKIKNIISGNFENNIVPNKNKSENEMSINFGLNSIFSNLVKIYCDYYENNSSSNDYKDCYLSRFNFYRYMYNKDRKPEELFILESIYLLLKDLLLDKILNDDQITPLIDNLSSINYVKYKDGLIEIPSDKLKSGNNYFYSKDNYKTIFYLGKLIDIKKNYKFFIKAFIFKYNDRDIFGETEISKDEFKGLKLFEIKQNTNNKKNINNKKNSSDNSSMFSFKLNSGMFGSESKKLISKARKLLNDKNSIITNYNSNKDEKNIGLVNCGNMCYAIAAIQFLYHNENIRNIILSYNINNINENNIIRTTQIGTTHDNIIVYIEILKCIKYIFYLFENNNSNIPIDLCKNGIFALLHSLTILTGRRYNSQEDSSEFLSAILIAVKELKINCGFQFTLETKYNAQNINGQGNIPEYTKVETNNNICQLIFTNQNTIQSSIDYYLNDIETLNDPLLIENGNNFKFYNKKQLFITESEKYIFFELKRFIYSGDPLVQSKLNNSIEINYNITFRVGNYNKTYKISGVICHLGKTTTSGHYTYNKFIMKNDVLYVTNFNDSNVTDKAYKDNIKTDIQKTCYILMYEEDETKRTLNVDNPLIKSNPVAKPVAKSVSNSANSSAKPVGNSVSNSAKPVAKSVGNSANSSANSSAKPVANSSAKSEETKKQKLKQEINQSKLNSSSIVQSNNSNQSQIEMRINKILEKYTNNSNFGNIEEKIKYLTNHKDIIQNPNKKTNIDYALSYLKRIKKINNNAKAIIKKYGLKKNDFKSSNNSIQPEKKDKEKLKEEINNILKKIDNSRNYTPQQSKDLSNRIKKILSNHSSNNNKLK